MSRSDLSTIERTLLEGPSGRFDEADLEGLPEAVQRYLRTAIAPGTPLARTARIQMRGHIKIGRWIPFRAYEVLTPHEGFLWAARAGGIISGSDHYAAGRGAMNWKVAGLINVMNGDGPDVSRSAAERAGAEAAWLPTTLLPRFGVEWTVDDDRILARFEVDGRPFKVVYGLSPEGHIQSVVFDRWGDPDDTGTWGRHPFGGEFSSHATFHGITIPDAGRLGWHYGTERWQEGEFFRYRITDMAPVMRDVD